jgi:hypothetical protein
VPWSNDNPRVAPCKRSGLALLGLAKALYDLFHYPHDPKPLTPGKARP